MLKDKRFIAVLGILLVSMLIYNVRFFTARGKTHVPRPAAAHISAPQPTPHHAVQTPALGTRNNAAAGHFSRLKPGSRNPFLTRGEQYGGKFPGAGADKGEGKETWPVLSGIAWNDGHWTALLNGEPAVPGDQIGEIRVIDITVSQVMLRWGAQTRTLDLSAPVSGGDA